jgi:peptidoglycan/LPS O-acetylase OafA/YrhL
MEKPPIRSSRFMFLGWIIAFSFGFWSIFGLYPATQGYNWPFYHLTYGAFHRTLFSIAFAWLVYACQTGRAQLMNTILGSRILLPLSSLSYSVYLVHLIAIAFTYLLEPFPMIYTSKWPIFGHCVVQLIVSYLMGRFFKWFRRVWECRV